MSKELTCSAPEIRKNTDQRPVRRLAVENLGCKVNRYESDAITQQFAAAGYEIVSYADPADVYIVNTCGVTAEAARKSRQQLHRAKRTNPGALVIAIGCQAELAPDELPADLCIGNSGKENLLTIVEDYLTNGQGPDQVQIASVREFAEFGSVVQQQETRAYLKVQDGCNNFCTYCAIPYARGRVRSRQEENILEEAVELAQAGFREVVLTGIHVCSYGQDRGEGSTALAELIVKLGKIEGIKRIRLSSLEPQSITKEFVDIVKDQPKLCPHFHLSLQSGSDPILASMKRKYDTRTFRQAVAYLRQAFPYVGITTDVIVGFPGETDEYFAQSYQFCREIGFSRLHVFRYSERPGTPAVSFPNKVPAAVAKARSEKLIELGDSMAQAAMEAALGRQTEVLLENQDEKGLWQGYTPDYLLATVDESGDGQALLKEGQIVAVCLQEVKNNRLYTQIL